MMIKRLITINLLCFYTGVFFLLCVGCHVNAWAEDINKSRAAPRTTGQLRTIEDLQQLLSNIQERIKQADKVAKSEAPGVKRSQLEERLELLRKIESYYLLQHSALKKKDALENELAMLRKKSDSGFAADISEKPPYSLALSDDASANLALALTAVQTSENALKVTELSRSTSTRELKRAQQDVREAREKLQDNKDPLKKAQAQWLLDRALLSEELAAEAVLMQEISLENNKKELEVTRLRVQLAKQNLDLIKAQLDVSETSLSKQFELIDAKESKIKQDIKYVSTKLQDAEKDLIKEQKKILQKDGEQLDGVGQERLNSADLWAQTWREILEQLEILSLVYSHQTTLWKRRHELHKKNNDINEVLDEWQKEAAARQEELQRHIALYQNKLHSFQLQIVKLDEQLSLNTLSSALRNARLEQKNALETLSRATFNFLAEVTAMNQTNLRFLDEITERRKEFTIGESITSLWDKVISVWRFEVFVIDEQSVRISQVVIALIILLVGIKLTKTITRSIQQRVFSRLHMTESAAATSEKLLHYTALLLIVLIALNTVNIPLTAFAFLGGALAIGAGFGAQKLINNFISGFIIMAEKPIKVGDLIQMDNELGWIEDIGVRSTSVRTYANTNILVPNSYFLENNIINWTHNNNIVRCQITVGVIYGSPTQKVKELLIMAAGFSSAVLKKPESYVWFSDFGDNALIFNLFFWISVTSVIGRQRIESEVRFKIDELFRENGLVIAFPQRDVHVDVKSPVQLEINRSSDEQLEKSG